MSALLDAVNLQPADTSLPCRAQRHERCAGTTPHLLENTYATGAGPVWVQAGSKPCPCSCHPTWGQSPLFDLGEGS